MEKPINKFQKEVTQLKLSDLFYANLWSLLITLETPAQKLTEKKAKIPQDVKTGTAKPSSIQGKIFTDLASHDTSLPHKPTIQDPIHPETPSRCTLDFDPLMTPSDTS